MTLSILLRNARTLRRLSILDAAKASQGQDATEETIRRACQWINELESGESVRGVYENELVVLARVYDASDAELDRWYASLRAIPRDIRWQMLRHVGKWDAVRALLTAADVAAGKATATVTRAEVV